MSVSAAHKKRVRLFEAQGGKCCYCGRPTYVIGLMRVKDFAKAFGLTYKQASDRRGTLEHLNRKADGGFATWDNLALACQHCNARRGDMNWVEYKTMKMAEYANA